MASAATAGRAAQPRPPARVRGAAFSEKGFDASLNAIAEDAGVGIGALHRHFPTREALIEAAYRNELGQLCHAGPALLQELPADQASRTWLDRFVGHLTTKIGRFDALRAVSPLIAAGALLVDDVLIGLGGITLAPGEPSQREQAGRLLDLLLDGLRFRG
ncbi:helix-turn-helix domain-containing protein [Amycolatopsis sp. NPDC023774]|uniref:TetR/AcrR family transcriptional regulator n=1 Tax=Amycolatopsis sp. NPDC023774 TaxID=3155015 RepID=UPI0033EBE46C